MALRLQPPRLDRIVRGRAWIPVLGVMLVAIVGLRVAVLKLGSSVGSQIQQATLLESSNTTLRTQISALSDNQRIEKMAEAYGMHLPNPLDVHFVPAGAGRSVGAAIRNISAPSNSTFLTGLATEQQNDQASTQASSSLSAVGAATGSTSTAATVTATNSATGSPVTTTTGSGATTQSTVGATSSSLNTSAGTGTSSGSVSPSSTGSTASTGTTGSAGSTGTVAGGSGLNTGPTNTAAGSSGSQTAGSTTSTGGTGLAG